MDQIKIRYGSSLNISITSDDEGATEATLYVGIPGQPPIITKPATFTDGVAIIQLEGGIGGDTEVPLGEYKYQINVEHSGGFLEKYPEADSDCEDCDEGADLPDFIVCEALDVTEVVS
jgi:hypothetical protein